MLKKVSPEAAFNAYKKGMNVVIHAPERWTPLQNVVFAIDYEAREKRGRRIVTPADVQRMEALLCKGFTYKRIAEETGFGIRTVIRHLNKKGGV